MVTILLRNAVKFTIFIGIWSLRHKKIPRTTPYYIYVSISFLLVILCAGSRGKIYYISFLFFGQIETIIFVSPKICLIDPLQTTGSGHYVNEQMTIWNVIRYFRDLRTHFPTVLPVLHTIPSTSKRLPAQSPVQSLRALIPTTFPINSLQRQTVITDTGWIFMDQF